MRNTAFQTSLKKEGALDKFFLMNIMEIIKVIDLGNNISI